MTNSEMCSKKTSKSIYKIGKPYITIAIFLLCTVFGQNVWGGVPIGEWFQNIVDKQAMDGTFKTIPGQASVSSLFNRSLTMVKGRDTQNISNSLSVVESTVNNRYNCTMTRGDVINILYYASSVKPNYRQVRYKIDTSFSRMVEQLSDGQNQTIAPTIAQRNGSCALLIGCNAPVDKDGKRPTIKTLTMGDQIRCENTVRDIYVDTLYTQTTFSQLTDGSFAENIFQNGTLDDSDYDLMYDISLIGRLLFESYIPPVELLYYTLPSVGSVRSPMTSLLSNPLAPVTNTTTNSGAPLVIGSFSEQQSNTQPTTAGGNQTNIVVGGVSLPFIDLTTDTNSAAQFNPTDPLDQQFIDQTNTVPVAELYVQNQSPPLIGSNICLIDPDPIIPAAQGGVQTITYQTYEQLLSEYYDTLNEANIIDTLLQDTDSNIVPSIYDITDPESVTNYADQIADLEQTIVSMIGSIFDVTKSSDDASIASCIADCQGLPPVDYAVCTAMCLCGEVGSPAIAANGFEIIQSNAFKIRFCQVPTSPTPITRGRKIMSIEEVFDEMRNILVSLKNSGELFKHVKTKELLDSSMKKNDFGKMFSFNLMFGRKKTPKTKPDQEYINQQIVLDEKLQAAVLQQTTNLTTVHERNKYIIAADVAATKSSIQGGANISDLINQTQEIRQAEQGLQAPTDLDLITKEQKTLIVNQGVAQFLYANFIFREEALGLLGDFNGIAENLRTKIEKAK